MRSRTAIVTLFAFAVAAPRSAWTTPSFDLEISSGAVTRLAMGATLHLRAYLPLVRRGTKQDVPPLEIRLRWSVEPSDLAHVTDKGVLTALRPGRVRVHVEDPRSPRSEILPAGTPGFLDLTIVEELEGGRLPRFRGAPPLERFDLRLDPTGKAPARLSVGTNSLRWRAHVTLGEVPSTPLPWVLEKVQEESSFSDDGFSCCVSVDDLERWRQNLASARLTVSSWKDGVASGRLEMKTTRGIELDFEFHAPLDDVEGRLARAAKSSLPR
jgi:hypothetical protein